MHYLVFDVETTGLEPDYHEIIQLGACIYDEKWEQVGETFLTNIYPEYEDRFSRPAAEVHNLSLQDLDDAPDLDVAIEDFEAWILKTIGSRSEDRRNLRHVMICGQSVTTDINFLKFAYGNINLNWEFSYRVLDLFVLSNYYFRILQHNHIAGPKSLSLGAVAEYFGFERELDTHNALEDAILTAKCLKIILENSSKFKVNKEDLQP
jgi:DNA polymerase III subunit epsilon